MDNDIFGYYAALNISHGATGSEIKAAYRNLVKLYHPDKTGSVDDEDIQRINEAYHVLGDVDRRADYDTQCAQPSAEKTEQNVPIEPLTCSQCGKVAAQPRYLVFWRVYSLILATGKNPVQGIFCAPCAKKEALKSTVFTSLLGWWGVPWGPIWTLASGFENAVGGKSDTERNDILAWHNAMFFIQRRQYELAYGISERLLKSQDRQIASAAADFTSLCRANGFSPKGELKDAWSEVKGQTPLRVGILLALPAAFAVALLVSGSGTSASQSSYASDDDPSSRDYVDASYEGKDSDGVDLLATPASTIEVTPVAAPIIFCSSPPPNGRILAGRSNLAAEGHRLVIDNGSSGNAIVKIRRTSDSSLFASFFVSEGREAQIDGIPDGRYSFQYAIGDQLDENCETFAGNFTASKFPDSETFEAEYVNDFRGQGYQYSILSYTLYNVSGGNVRPVGISDDSFNSD